MIISFSGLLVLVSRGSLSVLLGLEFNVGDLLLLASMICFAAQSIAAKRAMAHVSPWAATAFSCAIGSLMLLPLLVYVAAVAYIGIYVASAIYMTLFMWYFGKYPVWRGAVIGVAVSIVFFLMFEIWFLVPLPKGPLETWLGY